ncbi:hypothetical protein [uncultured Brachyspira sp.]
MFNKRNIKKIQYRKI